MILPNFLAAQHFLSTIAQTATPIDLVFQTFDDQASRKIPLLSKVFSGSLDQHVSVLAALNAAEAGVFLQVNRGGRGAGHVTHLRACFADLDGPAARECPIPPSITVQTSSKDYARHFYWLLKQPQPISGPKSPEAQRWIALQKRIAIYLGGDEGMARLDRVMRIPGFHHRKQHPSFLARIHEIRPECIYTLEQLEAVFPVVAATSTPNAPTDGKDFILKPLAGGKEATAEQRTAVTLQVRDWLTSRGVEFREKQSDHGEQRFLIDCPVDKNHKDAQIVIKKNGYPFASCFHASCGHNTADRFREFSQIIGGWVSAGRFEIGDHVEMSRRLLTDLRLDSPDRIRAHGNLLRRYENGVWRAIPEGESSRVVASYSGWRVGAKGRIKIASTDTPHIIQQAVRLTRDEVFDEPITGVAFTNGFVRVRSDGELLVENHKPEHFATFQLPFAYKPSTISLRFFEYLSSCFDSDDDAAQKIALLQEFSGACLVGIAPLFQRALILTGEGSNGKSLFASLLLKLFPPEAVSQIAPQDLSHHYFRANLLGVRLNAVFELPERELLDVSGLKALITGDPITARNVRERPFTFRPRAGHLFLANELPAVADHSFGFWRRMLVVQWNKKFPLNPAFEKQMATELGALACWALQGAARLIRSGSYTMPSSLHHAIADWREEANPVKGWLDCCIRDPDASPSSAKLPLSAAYASYRYWAQQNGNRIISSRTFLRRLKGLGEVALRHEKEGNKWFVALTIPSTLAPPILGTFASA